MLEEFFILIFGSDIIKGLGLNIRYLFVKAFNNKVKKEEFIGILKKRDPDTMFKVFNQNFYNLIVGYFCLLILTVSIGTLLL
jgi:hypothetical protein